jgi:proteasome regulatory subunit
MKSKADLEKAMFSYSLDSNDLEEENRLLKETINQLKDEVEKFKTPALLVGEIIDIMGNNAIIRLPNGNSFFVEISNSLKGLNPGDSVLLEQKNLTVVDKAAKSKKFNVEQFVIVEKPDVSWRDIGGLHEQREDIKEVIELPLLKPELFKKVGITPPKGILLYGPPGTGKTLLAKAVAASTNSTFVEIVGSELVQKFIGEGAKLVKEIFQLARERSHQLLYLLMKWTLLLRRG